MPRSALIIAAAILATTAPAAAAPPDGPSERATLFRLDKEWAQAAAAHDLEKTLSFWADDARVIPPGQPAVIGKEALRQYVTGAFAIPGFSIQWEPTDFVVSASGDIAYGVSSNSVTLNGPDGKPVTERGRAVTVWRKRPGETWKCVIDIWNAEPPATAAPVPR